MGQSVGKKAPVFIALCWRKTSVVMWAGEAVTTEITPVTPAADDGMRR
jgi:hypothetical protein